MVNSSLMDLSCPWGRSSGGAGGRALPGVKASVGGLFLQHSQNPGRKNLIPASWCVPVIAKAEKRYLPADPCHLLFESSLNPYSPFLQHIQGPDSALCKNLWSKSWGTSFYRLLCWDTDHGYGQDLASGVFCSVLITNHFVQDTVNKTFLTVS